MVHCFATGTDSLIYHHVGVGKRLKEEKKPKNKISKLVLQILINLPNPINSISECSMLWSDESPLCMATTK